MRLWLILASLAVFSAGVAAGALAFRTAPGRRLERRDAPFTWNDPFAVLVRKENVYQDLALDEQQRSMITHLLSTHEKRVKDIHATLSDLRSELHDGIYAALSPEQRNRFDAIQKEYRQNEFKSRVSFEVLGLKTELKLTPEEEAAVQPVLLDYALKKSELMQSGEGENEEKSNQLRKDRDERMKKALPAEKFEKYLEIKSRMRGGFPRDRKMPAPQPGPLAPPG
jgi:hypothetical protein